MGDLIGDREHSVKASVASDVEISAYLLILQRRRASLDLYETSPTFSASLANDRAIGNRGLALGVLEADLSEGIDARRPGRTQLSEESVPELRYSVHYGK
jgi:hypothetical protein